MNMEVKSVRRSPKGLARKRLGTKAHSPMKASPPLSSTKKNRTFRTIKAYVTSGTVLREVLSSPIGNIGFTSFFSGWICHSADCQVRQETVNVHLGHFARVRAVLKQVEAANPVEVGLFGMGAV